jgi:two-component system sensor histidine kinase EvgS
MRLEQCPAANRRPTMPAFDALLLREICNGNPAVEQRFLKALLQSNLSDARQILVSDERGDGAQGACLAHKVKGAASLVGAASVVAACDAFEAGCRQPRHRATPSAALPLLAALDGFNRAIRQRLRELAAVSPR